MHSATKSIPRSSNFSDFLLVSSLDKKPPLGKGDSVLRSGKCAFPRALSFSTSPPTAFLEQQMCPVGYFMCSNILLENTPRSNSLYLTRKYNCL